jgi:hypothetical protein
MIYRVGERPDLQMTPIDTFSGRWLGGFATLLLTAAAGAATSSAPPKLVLSEDGADVINQRTHQAWPRCVEGMRWTGKTCTGQPLLLDHAEAIALVAARRKTDGQRWRLPRVTELQRLMDKNAHPPGLDPVLFPAAPRDWHWSATANVNSSSVNVNQYSYGNIMRGRTNENSTQMAFLHGWAVNMATGEAREDVAKRTRLAVRLVRLLD